MASNFHNSIRNRVTSIEVPENNNARHSPESMPKASEPPTMPQPLASSTVCMNGTFEESEKNVTINQTTPEEETTLITTTVTTVNKIEIVDHQGYVKSNKSAENEGKQVRGAFF